MFQLLADRGYFGGKSGVGYFFDAGVERRAHRFPCVRRPGVSRQEEVGQLIPATFQQKLTNSKALLFRGLFSHATPGVLRRRATVLRCMNFV